MAATAHLKTPNQQQQHQPKPKRRSNTNKRRETIISTNATTVDLTPNNQRKRDTPIVVSPPENSWCCSAVKPPSNPSPTPPQQQKVNPIVVKPTPAQSTTTPSSRSSSSTSFKLTFSPGRVSPIMDSISSPSRFGVVVAGGAAAAGAGYGSYPGSYTKFNSALNAGLLNPMSPPPSPSIDKIRSSPTLFEMMANEQDRQQPQSQIPLHSIAQMVTSKSPISIQEKQVMSQQKLLDMLGNCSPGNQFNDQASSDVKLTLSSKDGLSVSMNVHRQILVASSRFFAGKLTDGWSNQQRSLPHIVEILDCDDVEIYIETLRLMYCKDLRRKLMKEDVPKVLGILKVSAAIVFDAGVLSCLEYLEAVPWAEDEEDKVASLLSQLHLQGTGPGEVLKRVSVEVAEEPEEGSSNEEVLSKLLQVVLEGKDEKARREMKGLVSKMLRENSSSNDLSKESLYSACDGCLQLLRLHFLNAASSDLQHVKQIARQADNLHWILDIMIDRQMAEDFLKTWADQTDLSEVHSTVPAIHRYEISRVTARLFVAIGKGQLVASKEMRCLLLRTWLGPFYEDFGWMRRASKGLDRHLIEDGLSNTILTLPLACQQEILLSWFDRFLNSGEDCPNIQRGFQVWWRRAFWKRNGEPERHRQLRTVTTM
ncbi:hypothetical protein GIB67_037248 [Kingdonia uniflora]|uniref:BTB domain-containing protein n=1 Tax=Kingdonia uniflora TaxID=39325 RepID=A0A7J7MRZ2_9MAGN|nr:hypothetical protein GIB67_037248 [Kingdonia uniflora]